MTAKQVYGLLITAMIALLLIIVGFIAWLSADTVRAVHVRDIVIALVGITMIVANLLGIGVLVLLGLRVTNMFAFLQNKLGPLLSSVTATVDRVQKTTNLVTDNIINPTIQVGGVMAGLRRGFSQFKRNSKKALR